jgi:hypothetical protein
MARPIPQATAAGASSRSAHHRGKAPLQIVQTPDVSEEESDEGTDMDAYLNTVMFFTQPI